MAVSVALNPAPVCAEENDWHFNHFYGDKIAANHRNNASSNQLVSVATQTSDTMDKLVDDYFDYCFRSSPDWATSRGVHEYDELMPDYSSEALARQASALKEFQTKFYRLDSKDMDQRHSIDRELIIANIKSKLLELEDIQEWKHNPDRYSSYANEAIYCLVSRDFAPMDKRLKSIVAREKQIKQLLEHGKKNVVNPPRIYTEIALEQLPGVIDFFETSVPQKAQGATDKSLLAEFESTNKGVVAALKDYQSYLKEQLLPKSTGSFALGKDNYSKKLLYEEMVATPLDKLLSDGEAELKRLQKEFTTTAAEIDPHKKARDVFTDISSEHPTPDKLIDSVAGVLGDLRNMCVNKKIVTIPFDDKLQVAEMPASMRALAFAAMDTPGPFEPTARESYYYVTLPEKDWKPARVEEHMRSFCKYDLLNTSVHEAFPGHFVQGLWERKAPSKTAKLLGCNSNVEGWAHYCEEMMVNEGLAEHSKKLKLVQIHDALLRVARYIVGIKMHTAGMTLEQGTDFFVNEGFQERENGLREAKRGTMDPTYLVYTLGKLQILELRSDYKKKKGDQYSLKQFHDEFLAQGSPPVSIIRRVMLGTETGAKF